jgi:O-antigen/teichoic acid export membrane protein
MIRLQAQARFKRIKLKCIVRRFVGVNVGLVLWQFVPSPIEGGVFIHLLSIVCSYVSGWWCGFSWWWWRCCC